MKAFISYSHNDELMLDMLHKHLAQLKREGLIQAWDDRNIAAGGKVDHTISNSLEQSQLFLALLSPDYIASKYCYEKEFQRALDKEKANELTIVPIIVEPCDWLQTPFKQFKALPKDGKSISLWENKNTAFLDVIQNLRRIIETGSDSDEYLKPTGAKITRNYRIQREFDTIEKMDFQEQTFAEIKEYLKRYINEIKELDNIKVKLVKETGTIFTYVLVNRNKTNSEAHLTVNIDNNRTRGAFWGDDKMIIFEIEKTQQPMSAVFRLSHDEYEMFWTTDNFYNSDRNEKLSAKEIAEKIWNEWLSSVGIV